MISRYYELDDDVEIPGRWYLDSAVDAAGRSVHPDIFTGAQAVQVTPPLTVTIRRVGEPLDWTFADLDMPVVKWQIGQVLQGLAPAETDLIPAVVVGVPDRFAVLNILNSLRCLDESRSEFIKWKLEDGRADRIGQYRQVSRLRISHAAVSGADIFRVDGWNVAIVVSERVKHTFEKHKVSGIRFRPV